MSFRVVALIHLFYFIHLDFEPLNSIKVIYAHHKLFVNVNKRF
jgi:hypothetical protein